MDCFVLRLPISTDCGRSAITLEMFHSSAFSQARFAISDLFFLGMADHSIKVSLSN
jgi:hypothetical protein